MSKRILVIEDQEDLRGVLRDLLTGSGYAVLEAADGEAGVASAKSEHPDLILMDIQMVKLRPSTSGQGFPTCSGCRHRQTHTVRCRQAHRE